MPNARVAIVGGLSGLYAALLEERGMADYVLPEARENFVGRIVSVPGTSGLDRSGPKFDYGFCWASAEDFLRMANASATTDRANGTKDTQSTISQP